MHVRERVVDLVRDAGREPAEQRHALGERELVVQAMLLGHVAQHDEPRRCAPSNSTFCIVPA